MNWIRAWSHSPRGTWYWSSLFLCWAIISATDIPRTGWWDLLRIVLIVVFTSEATAFIRHGKERNEDLPQNQHHVHAG